ncbi:projectin [Perkinsela sp. CCAP 1560/4]|nr:projectin [Perkinsela sp. CCAP 1560/4]|eukprot:KNH09226.1 projectin [Perkinsela sp. CCAP 1560/4]
MNILPCNIAKCVSRHGKNLYRFNSTSTTQSLTTEDKYLSYESPVDYNALGESFYERELNSIRYSQDSDYRREIGRFSWLCQNKAHLMPDIPLEQQPCLEDSEVKEVNQFFAKEDEYLRENNRQLENEHDLERHILGEPIFHNVALTYESQQRKSQVVHSPARNDTSLDKSKELKLKAHSTIVLKKAIQREVFAKPWITKYGILPESPFDIFAREVLLQRDYDVSYIKVLWEQLLPTERYAYEKAYKFSRDLKEKSKKDVKEINKTLNEVFVDKAVAHVRQQSAFQELDASYRSVEILLQTDIKMNTVPKAILELVAVIHKFERKHGAMVLNDLCNARLEQLRKNILHS